MFNAEAQAWNAGNSDIFRGEVIHFTRCVVDEAFAWGYNLSKDADITVTETRNKRKLMSHRALRRGRRERGEGGAAHWNHDPQHANHSQLIHNYSAT